MRKLLLTSLILTVLSACAFKQPPSDSAPAPASSPTPAVGSTGWVQWLENGVVKQVNVGFPAFQKGALGLSTPITLPVSPPDQLVFSLPNPTSQSVLSMIARIEDSQQLTVNTPQSDGQWVRGTLQGIASSLSPDHEQQVKINFAGQDSNSETTFATVLLRTPPSQISYKILPIDKNNHPTLTAANQHAAQIAEVALTNNSPGPVELTLSSNMGGTIHQQITAYGIDNDATGCNPHQVSHDASLTENTSVWLFVLDDSLNSDWVARTKSETRISLQAGESATLGVYTSSDTAFRFAQNGVVYGNQPTQQGDGDCGIGSPDPNSPPECDCGVVTYRVGSWGNRPTFQIDRGRNPIQVRWGDISREVDSETRSIPWIDNEIGIF